MTLPIWENAHMTEDRVFSRTWRERLFTCPWCPWAATRTVTVASMNVYKMHVSIPPRTMEIFGECERPPYPVRIVLVCHPRMAARIRASVKRDPHNYIHILRGATTWPMGS